MVANSWDADLNGEVNDKMQAYEKSAGRPLGYTEYLSLPTDVMRQFDDDFKYNNMSYDQCWEKYKQYCTYNPNQRPSNPIQPQQLSNYTPPQTYYQPNNNYTPPQTYYQPNNNPCYSREYLESIYNLIIPGYKKTQHQHNNYTPPQTYYQPSNSDQLSELYKQRLEIDQKIKSILNQSQITNNNPCSNRPSY